MDVSEVRAYYCREQGRGERRGYHLDIQPKGTDLIETVFVKVSANGPTVRRLISFAVQKLQRDHQAQSVTRCLEALKK
jgi:hypothetical protein